MKLHIPKKLMTALLACVMPYSYATTEQSSYTLDTSPTGSGVFSIKKYSYDDDTSNLDETSYYVKIQDFVYDDAAGITYYQWVSDTNGNLALETTTAANADFSVKANTDKSVFDETASNLQW